MSEPSQSGNPYGPDPVSREAQKTSPAGRVHHPVAHGDDSPAAQMFREHFFGETNQPKQPVQAPPDEPAHHRRRASGRSDTIASFMWLLASAALVLGVWRIGPLIVEEYQFALTSGHVRAEYENAFDKLKESPLNEVSMAYQLVAQRIRPSVVSIQTRKAGEPRILGQGSGVIMSSDGYIITNAHVVRDSLRIHVALYDRHRYQAKLIGIDTDSDLAVLKIDAPNLIAADWGDSDRLSVGSIVWAIGSPYGLDQTVTSGIVSGKNRQDEEHANRELIQTDAAVNPGNSGGPLVDAEGKVVGINTSIFGDSFQGISFAVPSSAAKFVYSQLINKGTVTRGYLGVGPGPVFQDVARTMNLENLDGAWITNVQPWSPAHAAGIRPNDVILEWNGSSITVHTLLYRLVEMTPPNQKVKVKLVRNGRPQELEVTVGDRNEFVKETPTLPGPSFKRQR